MTVIGIDVSKWDGNWNAQKAKEAGARFVFIKASQATFIDPTFKENWKKAREAGLLRGAYHYLDYTKPASDQVKYFTNLVKDDPGEFPLVIDFEHPAQDVNNKIPLTYLRQVTDYMLSMGKPPIIYTSPAFWKNHGEASAYWFQFPLWIANYSLATAPIIPPPWLSWTFWQFTAKGPGRIFGSEAADLDVNRFSGTIDELYALANQSFTISVSEQIFSLEKRITQLEKKLMETSGETPEETSSSNEPSLPPEPSLGTTAIVTKDKAPVYVGPFTALPNIGLLPQNTQVEILEKQADWARIKSPAGWLQTAYLRSADTPELDEYFVCNAYVLNVRTGPGTTYPVVDWLKKGQRVKVIDRNSGWVQIDSPAGWSMENHMKPAA